MGQCICPEIQLQAAGLPLFSTHALSNVKPVLKPAWVRIKEGKTTRWSFFKKKLFLMRFYFNLYTFWDCILTRQHLCNCLGLFDNIFAVINDRIRLIEMLEEIWDMGDISIAHTIYMGSTTEYWSKNSSMLGFGRSVLFHDDRKDYYYKKKKKNSIMRTLK